LIGATWVCGLTPACESRKRGSKAEAAGRYSDRTGSHHLPSRMNRSNINETRTPRVGEFLGRRVGEYLGR
jgi:hypothetical protein